MQYSAPFYYIEAITFKRWNYGSLQFDEFFLGNENKPEVEYRPRCRSYLSCNLRVQIILKYKKQENWT